MADDLLNGNLANIANILAAAGGLGAAAFGLVDALKAVGGGISNAGFSHIRRAIAPLLCGAGETGAKAFGSMDILATLRAHWLNGVAKAEQKAVAKSLIRLGLSPDNAPRLAAAVGIASEELRACAQRIRAGDALTANDLNALGRFDAIVAAVLDEGYERADQAYRNYAKLAAAVIAMVLAVFAGGLIFVSGAGSPRLADYFSSRHLLAAIIVGLVSTPLAPVAKDLSTTLSAAVKAVSALRR